MTVDLTPEEKAAVFQLAGDREDSYAYCKPCWKVATDKVQGLQLLKGMLQINLEQRGVRGAEEFAKNVQDFILKQTSSKKLS